MEESRKIVNDLPFKAGTKVAITFHDEIRTSAVKRVNNVNVVSGRTFTNLRLNKYKANPEAVLVFRGDDAMLGKHEVAHICLVNQNKGGGSTPVKGTNQPGPLQPS